MSGVTIGTDEMPKDRHAAGKVRARKEYAAKNNPRFYLKDGDLYLHWSGSKLTAHKGDAYFGSANQVEAIRRSISIAGRCRIVERAA